MSRQTALAMDPPAPAVPAALAAMALEETRDAFVLFDRALRYVYVNARAGALLGRSPATLVGRGYLELDPEAEGSAFHRCYVRALETGEPQVLDTLSGPWGRRFESLVYPCADGLVVRFCEVPVSRAGSIAGVPQAEYLRAVLDAAPVCIKVVGTDGRLLDVNAAGAEVLGMGQDVPRGADVVTFVVPDDRGRYRAAAAAALGGRDASVGFRLVRADGASRRMQARLAPLRDARGRVIAVLSVTEDVTERMATEARYRMLVETAYEGICTTDAVGVITYANPRLAELLGTAHEALVGRSYLDFVPAEERAAARASLERRRRGAAESREVRLLRADGTPLWAHKSASPLMDESGVFAGSLLLLGDLTARRQAEEALRASEERYALAARATRNAIWEWDVRTGSLVWNEGVQSVLGYPVSEVAPTLAWWEERIHALDRDRVTAGLAAVTEHPGGPMEWQDSYRFRHGDGRYVPISDRAYVARDAAGRAVRMVGAMEDVSTQRELEERLRHAAKMEAVGQLAGGIAHDFNNLLMIMLSNLELAEADLPDAFPASDEVRTSLHEIREAGSRARALVRQLLLFSRQQPEYPQLLDLGEVLRRSERLLRRLVGEEIAVSVSCGDAPLLLRADAAQLEQVLLNLAINARDAMLTPLHGHPGTGGSLEFEADIVEPTTATASDAVATAHRWVRLRVRDSGHGMDDATQRRLYEPFFTTKAVGVGTGLGLATVFGVVQRFGGTIQVASAPNAGTTFTILLPLSEELLPHVDAEGAASTTPSPTPLTVLLVEDEAAVRRIVRRMLERHGFGVLEARHGADALALWRAHRDEIGLLVTDVRMPEMGGRDLVAALHAECPALPVLYVSGYAHEAAHLVTGPREAFLEKPYTAGAVLAAVQRLLDPEPVPH